MADEQISVGRGLQPEAFAANYATSYAGVMAFLAVAAEGSFAKAGDRLGIGRSAVSRAVQRLEEQLSTRLFVRTTRSTSLTREGELFHHNCHPGMERIAEAVEQIRDLREGPPRGLLRIGASIAFGRKVIAPLILAFRDLYPDVSIELLLDDRSTDFIGDRIDIAFRNGLMDDSQIIARRIIPMQMALCASRSYSERHGLPSTVQELDRHRLISLRLSSGRLHEWEFKVDGGTQRYAPQAPEIYSDDELVLEAVLAGHGIAQLAGYQACAHLAKGTLVACLQQNAPDDRGHYLCYLGRTHMPPRMRVFIDFAIDRIRGMHLDCLPPVVPASDYERDIRATEH